MQLNSELQPSGLRISLGYPYKGTEYYEIAKKMGQLDETIEYHNYSTGTRFKFSSEQKLWIDKFKSFFWWWLNVNQNEYLYSLYNPLIMELESIDMKDWYDNKELILDHYIKIDREISKYLQEKSIPHYNAPYGDRPDIAIHQNNYVLKKELLDEH